MSERTGLRYGLLGLIVIALLAALAYFVARPTQTPAAAHAAAVEENQLQSLKDVAKQAPVHRKLDIQEWKTAEGAKVLFVEAHELPMFDLRLTFAAGSSQDAGTPGLSMLTNAMLNEGVPGKDTTAIAAGLRGPRRLVQQRLLPRHGGGRPAQPVRRRQADPGAEAVRTGDRPADLPRGRPGTHQEPGPGRFRVPEAEPRQAGRAGAVQAPLWRASLRALQRRRRKVRSTDQPRTIAGVPQESLRRRQRGHRAGRRPLAAGGRSDRRRSLQGAAPGPGAGQDRPAGNAQARPDAHRLPLRADPPDARPAWHRPPGSRLRGALPGQPDPRRRRLRHPPDGPGARKARPDLRHLFRLHRHAGTRSVHDQLPDPRRTQRRCAEAGPGLVRDYLANGPTQKELDDAKRELAGSFPLSTASNADIVGQLGAIGFYGLPLDYLESFLKQVEGLSVEQVRTAMAKHLDADAFVIVSAGPSVPQKPLPPPTAKPAQQPSGVPEH